MQYLMIDPHQRLLGTFISDKVLAVGDTVENHDAKSYTVIGLNWFKQRLTEQSITVIPTRSTLKVAEQV